VEVVGKKKLGIGIREILFAISILAIVSLFLFTGPEYDKSTEVILFMLVNIIGCAISAVALAVGIYILFLPNNIIAVSGSAVILRKKVEINFADIESIFEKQAGSRGFVYQYGEIIIKTKSGRKYKQHFVAKVRTVATLFNTKWYEWKEKNFQDSSLS